MNFGSTSSTLKSVACEAVMTQTCHKEPCDSGYILSQGPLGLAEPNIFPRIGYHREVCMWPEVMTPQSEGSIWQHSRQIPRFSALPLRFWEKMPIAWSPRRELGVSIWQIGTLYKCLELLYSFWERQFDLGKSYQATSPLFTPSLYLEKEHHSARVLRTMELTSCLC